ncbi:retropepsin-like aspartic endopeptidase [Vibrio ruber]|nr:RimK/LysX family protein [Vibrio ruber]
MKRPWKSWIILMLLSGLMGCSNTGSVTSESVSASPREANHTEREKVMQQIDQSYGYEFAPQSDVATQETSSTPAGVSDMPEKMTVEPDRENKTALVEAQEMNPVTEESSPQPAKADQQDWAYLPGIDEKFPTQLDQDAEISRLSVTDISYFQRSGQDWVQFSMQSGQRKSASVSLPIMRWMNTASGKTHTADERHAVVVTWVEFGQAIKERTEFMLVDAAQQSRYPVRIGQSFFRDMASHETAQLIEFFH